MVDLNLYVELVDWFDGLESQGRFEGRARANFDFWFERHGRVRGDALDYLLLGDLRLTGHPKGEDWEKRPRHAEFDVLVWTFHRVWIDRYGWEPTMELGRQRRIKSGDIPPDA